MSIDIRHIGSLTSVPQTLAESRVRLRLNPSKTQYIWLGTRQQLAKLDLAAMALRFPHIAFSLTVRYLGLTLDQQLTFAPHINRLCRDCYYQLRQLRIISLSHFHCYCYSCPRLCHISA